MPLTAGMRPCTTNLKRFCAFGSARERLGSGHSMPYLPRGERHLRPGPEVWFTNQADRPNGHGEATSGPRVKAATLYEEPRLDRCYRDDGQQISIGRREAIRAKAPRPGVRIRRVLAGA